MARTTKSKTKPAKRQYKRRPVEYVQDTLRARTSPPPASHGQTDAPTRLSDVVGFLSDDVTRLFEAIEGLEKRLILALQPDESGSNSNSSDKAILSTVPPSPSPDACPLVFMGFGLSSRIMAATNAIRYLERRVQL